MTGIDRAIVDRKLQALIRYLTALQPKLNLDLQAYLNDFEQQLIIERLLHLIVESAADVNSYLLVCARVPPPETYFDSFIRAGRQGIISQTLATALAPSTGLRNRLVHEYDAIDPVIVHQSIQFVLQLYPQYVRQIQLYLEQPSID
jgi:uncharacterized protein YutE (UPF0331/DUF86 family)